MPHGLGSSAPDQRFTNSTTTHINAHGDTSSCVHVQGLDHHLLWPPHIKAAIFDFDGTLADTLEIWETVDKIFMERRGFEYPQHPDKIMTLMGFTGFAEYVRSEYGVRDTPEELYDQWNEIGAQLYRDTVDLRPGALAYVKALWDSGVKIGLATLNDEVVIEEVLGRSGLQQYLHAQSYGSGNRSSKADPEFYQNLLDTFQVSPHEAILFEDYETGLLTGKNMGMITCAVGGANKRHNFERMRSFATLSLTSFETKE